MLKTSQLVERVPPRYSYVTVLEKTFNISLG